MVGIRSRYWIGVVLVQVMCKPLRTNAGSKVKASSACQLPTQMSGVIQWNVRSTVHMVVRIAIGWEWHRLQECVEDLQVWTRKRTLWT